MPVRRREFLAGVSGLSAAGAGCSGSEAPTATPIPSASSRTPTPRPGSVPHQRTFAGTAVAADGTAVSARRWFALPDVRYRTDDGEYATVEPVRDRFVGYEFTVENRSEERLSALPDTRFTLRVADGTYEHVHALAGQVPFRRASQPDGEPEIRPQSWYDWLGPGEPVELQLVFDAPAAPDYRHYLAWDHLVAVEGDDGPAYLFPRS